MNWEMFDKRIQCWEDTKIKCSSLNLPPESIKIKFNNNFIITKKYEKSNIKFHDMDAINCGLMYSENDKTLVLNLSDDCFSGGCIELGSGAQEESLFRRTNYFQSLLQKFYPIKSDEAVYSPCISIIKSSENTNWKLYNQFPILSFIACPGIKYPRLIDGEKLNTDDTEKLKNKIKLIIQVAVKYNYNTIIFGALGCGAWKNPAKHVAEIFKEVLQYNYIFAIMTTDDDNYIVRNHNKNPQTNIEIFLDVFNTN